MNAPLFRYLLEARAAKRAVAVVTRLSDGNQSLVDGNTVLGDLAVSGAVFDEIRTLVAADQSAMIRRDEALFVRTYGPAPRLLIVGASHIAQSLAPMAMLTGYEVTVIDPRRAFAKEERFPGVALTDEWPDEAMARLAPDVNTAVVTLTHDPKIDDPALLAALASPAFYIGALGSSRTHAKRVARFKNQGLEQIHRIHAPVGLDIGGRSTAEIAVSVLAEIIKVRCGKSGQRESFLLVSEMSPLAPAGATCTCAATSRGGMGCKRGFE